MGHSLLVLPGDGIGAEVMAQLRRIDMLVPQPSSDRRKAGLQKETCLSWAGTGCMRSGGSVMCHKALVGPAHNPWRRIPQICRCRDVSMTWLHREC